MSLIRTIGRPVYTCFDAVSKLREMPFGAGDDAIVNAVGTTFKIAGETFLKDTSTGKSLLQGAFILQGVRDVISKVVSVPKSWDDLSKAMKKMPTNTKALISNLKNYKVACLKGFATVTGAVGKTIGMIDYTSKWFNNAILVDLPQLAPLAATLGEYRVFNILSSAGSTGLNVFNAMGCKKIKNPLAYVTGTVKIIANITELYNQVQEEAADANKKPHNPLSQHDFECLDVERQKKETENDQNYYKYGLCFFKCTTELVKMYFTYVGGGAKGNLPRVVGVIGAIIQNSDMLFSIYKLQRQKVNFPAWLE